MTDDDDQYWKLESCYDANFDDIMKNKSCPDTNFVVTGSAGSCHYDNLQCHQEEQSWHHDRTSFSDDQVGIMITLGYQYSDAGNRGIIMHGFIIVLTHSDPQTHRIL